MLKTNSRENTLKKLFAICSMWALIMQSVSGAIVFIPKPVAAVDYEIPIGCGDGLTNWDLGETCDAGAQNGVFPPPPYGNGIDNSVTYCSSWCTQTTIVGDFCGDGILNEPVDPTGIARCDDGNKTDGDGCSAACLVETGYICDSGSPTVCIAPDSDGDGITDLQDNCSLVANPLQEDTDKDGQGDVCDTDKDGDGIVNETDNCPAIANPLQEDLDKDNIGDACDLPQCGNGYIETGEQCDGTTGVGEHQKCTSCVLETLPYCGDAIINGTEQCDGTLGTDPAINYCNESCQLVVKTGTLTVCAYNDTDKDGFAADDLQMGRDLPWEWNVDIQKVAPTTGSLLQEKTSTKGCVTLPNIEYGTYNITEQSLPHWITTSPNGNTQSVVMSPDTVGANNTVTVNFANHYPQGSISGYKWNDANSDGLWTGSEPALTNYPITLCQLQKESDVCTPIATTYTDNNGKYTFDKLLPGNYQIQEGTVSGWTQTYPSVEGSPAYYRQSLTADQNIIACTKEAFSADQSNEQLVCLNFGNHYAPVIANASVISGFAYEDANNNGQKDTGEQYQNDVQVCMESPLPAEPVDYYSLESTMTKYPMNSSVDQKNRRITVCAKTGTEDWADGYYEFTPYVSGQYRVFQSDNTNQTQPANKAPYSINVGQQSAQYVNGNFGNYYNTPYCGNGVKDSGEQCDGTAGTDTHNICTNSCQLVSVAYCGDNIKNGSEECDGSAPVGYTCSNLCTLKQGQVKGETTTSDPTTVTPTQLPDTGTPITWALQAIGLIFTGLYLRPSKKKLVIKN